ncbi:hypothetical protein VTJ49DRAFT_3839 [Mycothermus thermophilus]|uniref:SHSP domain-containing protein n=1 Tax=Humicola insolens TaxID=85995 RepID=A0ABR3VR57_HUMIN
MSLLQHPRFSNTAPGFSSLFRMLDDFDRYASQQLGSVTGNVASFSPKFDVAEHEKEYVLQGELPGVPPQNVEIEFTDEQTLVVRGHHERTHTEGDQSLLEAPQEAKKIEGKKEKETAAANGKPGEEGKSKPRYWLSERSYGEFSRVFSFPSAVDQDNVQAKFSDGVLEIKVPKTQRRGTKKITISSGSFCCVSQLHMLCAKMLQPGLDLGDIARPSATRVSGFFGHLHRFRGP